jgi:hypothetical protein
MLLVSEAYFFDQPAIPELEQKQVAQAMRPNPGFKLFSQTAAERSPARAHTGSLLSSFPGRMTHPAASL